MSDYIKLDNDPVKVDNIMAKICDEQITVPQKGALNNKFYEFVKEHRESDLKRFLDDYVVDESRASEREALFIRKNAIKKETSCPEENQPKSIFVKDPDYKRCLPSGELHQPHLSIDKKVFSSDVPNVAPFHYTERYINNKSKNTATARVFYNGDAEVDSWSVTYKNKPSSDGDVSAEQLERNGKQYQNLAFKMLRHRETYYWLPKLKKLKQLKAAYRTALQRKPNDLNTRVKLLKKIANTIDRMNLFSDAIKYTGATECRDRAEVLMMEIKKEEEETKKQKERDTASQNRRKKEKTKSKADRKAKQEQKKKASVSKWEAEANRLKKEFEDENKQTDQFIVDIWNGVECEGMWRSYLTREPPDLKAKMKLHLNSGSSVLDVFQLFESPSSDFLGSKDVQKIVLLYMGLTNAPKVNWTFILEGLLPQYDDGKFFFVRTTLWQFIQEEFNPQWTGIDAFKQIVRVCFENLRGKETTTRKGAKTFEKGYVMICEWVSTLQREGRFPLPSVKNNTLDYHDLDQDSVYGVIVAKLRDICPSEGLNTMDTGSIFVYWSMKQRARTRTLEEMVDLATACCYQSLSLSADILSIPISKIKKKFHEIKKKFHESDVDVDSKLDSFIDTIKVALTDLKEILDLIPEQSEMIPKQIVMDRVQEIVDDSEKLEGKLKGHYNAIVADIKALVDNSKNKKVRGKLLGLAPVVARLKTFADTFWKLHIPQVTKIFPRIEEIQLKLLVREDILRRNEEIKKTTPPLLDLDADSVDLDLNLEIDTSDELNFDLDLNVEIDNTDTEDTKKTTPPLLDLDADSVDLDLNLEIDTSDELNFDLDLNVEIDNTDTEDTSDELNFDLDLNVEIDNTDTEDTIYQ